MAFEPIENYGVIGNMQSIALVGMNGSIDFMCYPEFDSPTVFAALLDDHKGGRFQIRPRMANMRARQLYLPDTNILLTRFLADEGVVAPEGQVGVRREIPRREERLHLEELVPGRLSARDPGEKPERDEHRDEQTKAFRHGAAPPPMRAVEVPWAEQPGGLRLRRPRMPGLPIADAASATSLRAPK